jgi:uncharacterized protein (UPF0332 family)
VIWKRFAQVLVRKSQRALESARHDLTRGDFDGAVNRSYYAMFDIVRAALLRAGIAEDKLPRTHNGVIELFHRHAVRSGLLDQQLAGDLSRTESLRIRADYTDLEVEPKTATEVVAKAARFVHEVQRAFDLELSSLATGYENNDPDHDDKVSETPHGEPRPMSFEEERRQARENWLRLRQQTLERDAGRAAANDQDRSLDVELDD